MAGDGHLEALRAAVAALNSGSPEGYLQAFTPTSLRWVPGIEEPFALAAIAENIGQLSSAFTGFVLGEELLFGSGRHVCARWLMEGTHSGEYLGIAPTGRSISVEQCEVYEFDADDGGRVINTWSYGDPLAMFRQLGVVPGAEAGQ
ncbi:MAG: ester cyclase [Acidimicrobiia bacterium]